MSALQVLTAMCAQKKTLAELTQDLKLMPQVLINKPIEKGFDYKTDSSFTAEIEAVEKELGDRGRVLIRPSGTEPLLRIMVEADDEKLARECAERIAGALKA